MHKSLRLHRWAIILIFICVSLTVINAFNATLKFSGIDTPNHFLFSIEFYNPMINLWHDVTIPWWAKIKETLIIATQPVHCSNIYWPNGFNAVAALFYGIFNPSIEAARMAMIVFLALLLMSVYGVGTRLYGRGVGIFAVVLTFLTPMIFQSAIQPQLDLPVTAFITCTLYFMLRSNYFSSWKASLLFGIILGVGSHMKGQALFFLAVPIIFYIEKSIINGWRKRESKGFLLDIVCNMVIAFSVGGLIASMWWVSQWNSGGLIDSLHEHVLDPEKAFETPFLFREKYTIKLLTFHIRTLAKAMGPLLYGFFIISFAFGIMKRKINRMLISWVLIPLALFSFAVTIKHTRFLMPIIPAAAIIMSVFACSIRRIWLRYFLCVIIVIYGIIQFYALSFDKGEMRDMQVLEQPLFGRTHYEDQREYYEDLKADELVQEARKLVEAGKDIKIGLINLTYEHSNMLKYSALLMAEDSRVYINRFQELYGAYEKWFERNQFLLFVIPKDYPHEWPSDENIHKYIKLLQEDQRQPEVTEGLKKVPHLLLENKNRFEFVKAFETTNPEAGDYVHLLYKKKVDVEL
ncbi:ArnT family glycosyltransferase [Candidatus Omnitrophota bacterium]